MGKRVVNTSRNGEFNWTDDNLAVFLIQFHMNVRPLFHPQLIESIFGQGDNHAVACSKYFSYHRNLLFVLTL